MDLVASTEFLSIANSSSKDLKSKIIKTLSLLANDPKHPSLHFKRVKGTDSGVFECRIDQDYRMIVSKQKGFLKCLYFDNHDSAIRKAKSIDVGDQTNFVEEVTVTEFSDEFWRFEIHQNHLEKSELWT